MEVEKKKNVNRRINLYPFENRIYQKKINQKSEG